MAKQLFWEDIEVAGEVTPLSKVATRQMLVRWAGASGDFQPIHYDDSLAAAQGLGKSVVQGALKRQWLVQLMTDWIGEQGTLKKLSCQHRVIDYPRGMKSMTEPEEGETWWCKGTVTKKYVEDEEHYIDCNIRVEYGKGETTTPGKATVVLPSRG